jgi:alpha-1,2-mannosyltransferase
MALEPRSPAQVELELPVMVDFPRPQWPTPLEKWGVALFAAVIVVFGGLVEYRSAYLSQRMGDLSVFVRTAWALRVGQDIYSVTDEKGFHYHYPPLFAILLAPLADPPPGVRYVGALPYPAIVALWYVFNVICLALAVHWLASALERSSTSPVVRGLPRGCRRWWGLRLLPVLACLPPIGHTLMRGQVGLLLLLLLCGLLAALLQGRRFQAGLWLAGAICLKVIPALLVLYPLWRRDGRCLAGCALGLLVGLLAVPAVVMGPQRTVDCYREWTHVLLGPALGAGDDQSRAHELIEITATDSQSFQAVLHNTWFADRDSRPANPPGWIRAAHWFAGGLLTALTILAARRRTPTGETSSPGAAEVLAFGALVLLMLLLSPVCHLHYFCLAVPLVMGLLAIAWEGRHSLTVRPWLLGLLACNVVANSLPHFPGCQVLRDGGLAGYATLALWTAAVVTLHRRNRPNRGQSADNLAIRSRESQPQETAA